MPKVIFIALFFFLILGQKSFSKAEEMDQKSSDTRGIYDGLKVHLAMDKTVFSENSSLPLQITVMNEDGPKDLSIFPSKEFFNYYVEVYSQDGISMSERDSFFSNRFNDIEAEREKTQHEGLKNIELAHHQIMGEVIDLNNLFKLPIGRYLIRIKFYPKSVFVDSSIYLYSPYIQLIIEPGEEQMEKESKNLLSWEKEKQNIDSPEDAVRAYFSGKQEGNWDKFFYVLDLGRLITIFPEFYEPYQKGTSEQKDSVLANFRAYLKDVNTNENIRSVNVAESIIRGDQAILKTIVQISLNRRLLSREYIFKLEKQDHWNITAYTVNVR